MIPNKSFIILRYITIVVLMASLATCIIFRAGVIIVKEKKYWEAVGKRYIKENQTIYPNRGNIISADGKLMASSLPEYRLYVDFGHAKNTKEKDVYKKDTLLMNNLAALCKGLHELFPDKSEMEFRKTIMKGRKAKSRHFLIYPKKISYLDYQEVKRLPVFNQSPNLSGLHVEAFNRRKKPFGSLAMRTLGDMFPDMTKGAKNGLELTYDSILKGHTGIVHRQKVMNKYLSIIDKPAIDGNDIITTIDVGMQDIAEKALVDQLKNLEALSGTAVVMEVATGDVKANVNMTRGNDGNYYEMRNLAVSNLMEPGSTFKTASIMVAMEDKYITPDYIVDTGNGIMNMHGSPMKDWNWYKGGYGKIDVTKILEVSSNIGVSSIIDHFYQNNPQKFVDGLKRMSIDTPLNLGFVGEASPRIRGPKERYFAKTTLPWMSIGYETMIPPIYILNFYNAIANNGVMVKPKFVKAISKDGTIIEEFPTEIINPKICSDTTLTMIRTILRKVVSQGLAKPAGSKQFSVSGKTGTAQISQGKAGYKAGGVSYLVSFCGYFPSEAPKYSCIVQIQIPHGPASGGLQAGSVFSKIAERVYAKHLFRDIKAAKDSLSIFVPQVKQGDMAEAAYVLRELGIKGNSSSIPYVNYPLWGTANTSTTAAELHTRKLNDHVVPNVVGMGAKDAIYLLEKLNMRVHLSGVGKVGSQSIPAGSTIHKGQTITLKLKY